MNRKKVFITGAASGIGKEVAIRFANEGYDVCLNDIQTGKLQQALEQLPIGDHFLLSGSYADKSTMQRASEMIAQSWGALDVLVNCAGVSKSTDPVAMDIDEWRSIFDIMVNGCLLVSKMAVPFMREGGRIIHISSIHAFRAEKSASSYAMAKAAINQCCRALAVELADRNILVNAIAPGFVDTPMSIINGKSELESEWFRENYVKNHHLPLKRAAQPSEIAGVAFFLAGKDASYITGQVITVDGGLTITF
ncbi:MAG TPA: SDR family oxidoreductase [Chitinophagaceae bacterium]|jgi:3-oxoacyl-[acyl-carrier protein] reductase